MTTSTYAVIIAPVWAVCEVCGCPCAGEPVEVCYIAEQPRYSHVDLVACLKRWEEAPAESEAANG
jgi:hypothetical protein